MLTQLLAKRLTVLYALAGQLQTPLPCSDQPHTVMHPSWCQPALGNFKTSPLAQEQIIGGHPHISEGDFSMADGCVVISKRRQRAEYFHTGGVLGHKDLRLL